MKKTTNRGCNSTNAYFNCYLVSRYVTHKMRLDYDITRQEIDALIIVKKLESKGFNSCTVADMLVFAYGSLAYNMSKTVNKLIRRGLLNNTGKRIAYSLSLTEEANFLLDKFYVLCQDKIKDLYDKFEVKKGLRLNKRQRLKVKRAALSPPSEDIQPL